MDNADNASTVISFFGPPGSGKGTLAERCETDLNYLVLSTGNLCRKHVSAGTEIGKKITHLMKKGQLIPDELVTNMVWEWLVTKLLLNAPIILDGYPRTRRQASLFTDVIKKEGFDFSYHVICFEISHDEIIRRLSSRLVCSNNDCQTVYSTLVKPPKQAGICDKCGASLFTRSDDTPEVVKERLREYEKHKKELLDFYQSLGQPIFSLPVENRTPEKTYQDFLALQKKEQIGAYKGIEADDKD